MSEERGLRGGGRSAFRHRSCPRCGARESTRRYEGADYLHQIPGTYYVACCSGCGLWFQNPCPGPEGLAALYPAEYAPHALAGAAPFPELPERFREYLSRFLGYRQLVPPREHAPWRLRGERLRAGVDLVPHFVPQGSILEVGCARGDRLRQLRQLGWQRLTGIELASAAAAQAQGLGFEVVVGPFEECVERFPEGSFDVVIASMVLEHLLNPFEAVERIAERLKPGGEFLFSTIVCDSLDSGIYGSFFAGFDFPRHLVHFRKRDLQAMLVPHFERVELYHQNAPIDYVRSSSWRMAAGKGNLFDRLVLRLGGARPAHALGGALTALGLTCRVSVRCRRKGRGHGEG